MVSLLSPIAAFSFYSFLGFEVCADSCWVRSSVACAAASSKSAGKRCVDIHLGGRITAERVLNVTTVGTGRDRSPGLQWHKEYNEETMKRPRVLMIDYIRKSMEPFFGSDKKEQC